MLLLWNVERACLIGSCKCQSAAKVRFWLPSALAALHCRAQLRAEVAAPIKPQTNQSCPFNNNTPSSITLQPCSSKITMLCKGDNSITIHSRLAANPQASAVQQQTALNTQALAAATHTRTTQPTLFLDNKVIHRSLVLVVTETCCNDGGILLRLQLGI